MQPNRCRLQPTVVGWTPTNGLRLEAYRRRLEANQPPSVGGQPSSVGRQPSGFSWTPTNRLRLEASRRRLEFQFHFSWGPGGPQITRAGSFLVVVGARDPPALSPPSLVLALVVLPTGPIGCSGPAVHCFTVLLSPASPWPLECPLAGPFHPSPGLHPTLLLPRISAPPTRPLAAPSPHPWKRWRPCIAPQPPTWALRSPVTAGSSRGLPP